MPRDPNSTKEEETIMQYMALICGDPELQPKPGTPEFDTMMKGYFATNEIYRRDGVLVAGEPLQGVETATSLRIRGGKTETMDGPLPRRRNVSAGSTSSIAPISMPR
jgi:hypothetical protein